MTAVNANQGSGTIQRSINTGRSQRMNYYQTYVKDMEIVKLEQPGVQSNQGSSTREDNLEEVMKATFINAFPIALSEINLDTNGKDQIVSFNVAFTYESYSLSYENLGQVNNPGLF